MGIFNQFVVGFVLIPVIGFGQSAPAQVPGSAMGIRDHLIRTALIDWRLRRAALKDCDDFAKRIGVILDSEKSYANSSESAAGDLAEIVGLMPSDVARAAGVAPGDHLIAIQGRPVSMLMSDEDGVQLVENILLNMDRLAGREGFHVEIERHGVRHQVDLAAEDLCSGLTVVRQSKRGDAYSDLHNIAITTGLLDRMSSDDQVAFVIGHEMAHTIYADSRNNGLSRMQKEKRADLYGVHIAACAGFDPSGAIEALAIIKESHAINILSFTHPSYSKRQRAVKRYLAERRNCEEPFQKWWDERQ